MRPYAFDKNPTLVLMISKSVARKKGTRKWHSMAKRKWLSSAR